jgi:hypothetical protein
MNTIITKFVAKSTNTTYVCLLDIRNKNINHEFFKGCGNVGTSVRSCIKKNDIPECHFIFVEKNKVSNHKNTRAQPYVTEKYAIEWIYDQEKIKEYRANIKAKIAEKKKEELHITRIERKEYDSTQLQSLPDIVDISDEDAFKDNEGTSLHIEMRGKKTHDGLYMKALDIEQQLRITCVYRGVTHANSDFEYNKHYVFFTTEGIVNYDTSGVVENTPGKVLYLTYFGVIKLLICSRSKNAEQFQKWVITTLFTHQFGDQDQKDELASNLLGITAKTLYDVLRRSSNVIPCVYLFKIGKVGDVRKYCKDKIESINLEGYVDDDILYKFGKTNDLARRTREHANTYGKMSNDFTLETFNYIDKALACKAEKSIKDFFNASDMRINDDKHIVVVVIKPNKMKYTIEWFKNVQMMYSGNSYDLIQQINEMRHNHAMELMKKEHDNQILQKENDKLCFKHKSELQEMEITILKERLK